MLSTCKIRRFSLPEVRECLENRGEEIMELQKDWIDEDVELLKFLFKKGYNDEKIGEILGRNNNSIRSKRQKLGLLLASLQDGKTPNDIRIVPIDKLHVHYLDKDTGYGYQRDPTPSLLSRIKKEGYDEQLSPVIDVVERKWDNGDIYIVDGGTRYVAAKEQGITHMTCKFHETTTYLEEPILFYKLNKKRSSVPSYNQYNARLQYQDPKAVGIHNLITKCGFTLGKTAGYNTLGGASRLEELMNGNAIALEQSLIMLHDLCEPERYPAVEGLVRGLYYIAANVSNKDIFEKNGWVHKRLMIVGAEMLNKYCNEHAAIMRTRSTKTMGDAILERINYRAADKNKIQFVGDKK